jgi:small subunit ribosomal protein S1
MPNPWDGFAEKYNPGDLVEGVVESVADFGAFIRLTDAIVGLIHVSEMGDYGNRTPADVFKENDEVLVRITEIDVDRERVGLSTKRVSREEAFDWMINDLDEDEAAESSTVSENSVENTEDAQSSTELES